MPKVSKKKLHTFFDYRDVWFEFPDLSANLKQVLIFRRVIDDLVGINNFLQSLGSCHERTTNWRY